MQSSPLTDKPKKQRGAPFDTDINIKVDINFDIKSQSSLDQAQGARRSNRSTVVNLSC